jgi:hypothetical protein
MSVAEILQNVRFVVDADGTKKAVLLNYSLWKELLTQLEDLEDAEEIRCLREAKKEEVISWEQAKGELRARGVDV